MIDNNQIKLDEAHQKLREADNRKNLLEKKLNDIRTNLVETNKRLARAWEENIKLNLDLVHPTEINNRLMEETLNSVGIFKGPQAVTHTRHEAEGSKIADNTGTDVEQPDTLGKQSGSKGKHSQPASKNDSIQTHNNYQTINHVTPIKTETKVLILGDSILKNLEQHVSSKNIQIKSMSGARIQDMSKLLSYQEAMPEIVVLHTGTNNFKKLLKRQTTSCGLYGTLWRLPKKSLKIQYGLYMVSYSEETSLELT